MHRIGTSLFVTLALLAACRGPLPADRTSALTLSPDGSGAPAIDASLPVPDGPPDSPPDAATPEVHGPGPLVTWATDVRQPLPYGAAAGPHRVAVRLTGNNGTAGNADGVSLSIDGGVPCPSGVRPPDWPPSIGSTTECAADVVSLGTGDSLTLDLHEDMGFEGWDVQHEYYSVDGGPWVEVVGP